MKRLVFSQFLRTMTQTKIYDQLIFVQKTQGPEGNRVSTTTVFGLCRCKQGIFVLVGDPLQSHYDKFHVTRSFPSPKMRLRQEPLDTGQNFKNDCPKAQFFKAYLKVKNPKLERFWPQIEVFEGLRSSKNLIFQNSKINLIFFLQIKDK